MSLQKLLKMMQTEVKTALEELTCITTHDDNLERQYKEGGLAAVMPWVWLGLSCLRPSMVGLAGLVKLFLLCTAVSENVKLRSDLEKSRYEIRVSILS